MSIGKGLCGAVAKGNVAPRRQICDINGFQTAATRKCINTYSRHAVWYVNRFQVAALLESIVVNGCHVFRNIDGFQAAAAIEGRIVDVCQFCEVLQLIERCNLTIVFKDYS